MPSPQKTSTNSIPSDEKVSYKLKLTFTNGISEEIHKEKKDPRTWWCYWLSEIRFQSEIEKLELEITEGLMSEPIKDDFYDKLIDEVAICKSLIKEVIIHSRVLTPSQQEKLDSILRDNKVTAANNRRQGQWGVIVFFIMLAGAWLAGCGLWSMLGLSLIAMLMALVAATLKGFYNNKAFNSYISEPKVVAILDSQERAAFENGVKASTWPAYLTSFTHFCTYRHPLAFAAGMQQAIIEKQATLTKTATSENSI